MSDSLHALTERLRPAPASRALVYAAFTVLYLVPTLWLASGKLIWDDEFFTLVSVPDRVALAADRAGHWRGPASATVLLPDALDISSSSG